MLRPARYSADAVVVGKVAVMDQRLVEPDERVRAARDATRGPWSDSADERQTGQQKSGREM